VHAEPGRFTAKISKRERRGKILIDTLRNQRDATAIASYSVRARPGAPVAMPLAWDELDPAASRAPVWSVREAAARLDEPDPWKAFEASRRVLGKPAQERVRID
jgi:bifunctional non-homologous end joining protein LigD